MSAWVHVAGIVRIDMFRFPEEGENDEKEIIELMTNNFGKELSFYDKTDKWEDAYKHPEYYLPFGSEGSLKMSVWINPDICYMAAVTVSIFGDLRDYTDVNKIIEWFKKKCNSKNIDVRNACITVNSDYDEPVVWCM